VKAAKNQTLTPFAIVAFVVLGLAGLGGIGFGLMTIFGGNSSSNDVEEVALAERPFLTLKHDLGKFQIDYPEGWTTKTAGGEGGYPPSAQIEGDDAEFTVKSSLGGAAIADIAGAGGATLDLGLPNGDEEESDIDRAPVATVHGFHRKKYDLEYSDYEESPPETIQANGFGEGRLSMFTASAGAFAGRIKGFRATFLAPDFQYNIFCQVPERKFDAYEPLLRKMIASFRR
jgi:hypothetical protein